MRRETEQGYLLVEALMATVILSVGIIALLSAFQRSVQVAGLSARHTAALTLIEHKLIAIEEGPSESGTGALVDSLAAAQGFEVNMEPVDIEGPLDEITITVSWEDAGRRSAVSLTTLYFGSYP
jgi:Tfp pilus assembly protein PilV